MSDSARNVKANAATAAIGARLRALVFNTFVPPRGLLSLGKPVKSASPPHVAVVMQSVCTSSMHRQRIETHQDFNTSMTLPSINVDTILVCAAGCGAITPKSRPDTLERNTWCSHLLYRDSSVRVLDSVEDSRQQAVCWPRPKSCDPQVGRSVDPWAENPRFASICYECYYVDVGSLRES